MEKVYEKNLIEIYRITPELYFRKADLITRGQCNGAFLVGSDSLGVVDAPTPEGAAEMLEEAQSLFGLPVSIVFITHGHEDHVGGLPLFLRMEVSVFCSDRLLRELPRPTGATQATIVGLRDRTTVRLPGLDIVCLPLDGTAHSPWDMLVRVPSARLVCAGDTVTDHSLLHFHYADVDGWVANLRSLESIPDELVLPGHGDVYPFSKISETAAFIETLKRAAESCLSRLSLEEIRTISEQRIDEIARAYLAENKPEAAVIRNQAENGALRELRMVLRYLLYRMLK